ncbi:MAG: FAD-dependent oxidoreductase, partial [Melioribacteraceae bacterium]|nr:FAD-dependent oxidoreductase [Melioribacteraceae bacterium]
DSVVLAIPHYSIEKIKSADILLDEQYFDMETSPIITIHIWEKEDSFKKDFIGLIDSNIHWVFNNGNHISIVISGADNFINRPPNEIIGIVTEELNRSNSSFTRENILYYKIIKEKRATLKCTPENENLRESLSSNIKNLHFAGDWTNTELPGTIEGAVLSGKLAANEINSQKK